MKPSKANPALLIGLSILGTLIAASALFVILIASRFRHHANDGSLSGIDVANLIVMLSFLGGGWYLSIWTQQELSNGIALDRWIEEQLRPARALSESRIEKAAPVALLVLGLVLYLIETSSLHHSGSIGFWFAWCCAMGSWL